MVQQERRLDEKNWQKQARQKVQEQRGSQGGRGAGANRDIKQGDREAQELAAPF